MSEVIYRSSRIQNKVHPKWSLDAVIYELNVRQYTHEGTFKAAMEFIPRIVELGVKILWMMPVFPIGNQQRKGTLGSYYSIADYGAVNPEFGSMDDFKELIRVAHENGLKVILDWVTNHTARDAKWVYEHPDWYQWKDGEIATPWDWSDTAQLNYDNFEMRAQMCEMMKYWLRECDVDGFRMDMAMLVPGDFWEDVIPKLIETKNDIFMLAEAQGEEFHRYGFDATYGWDMHHLFNSIAKKEAGSWQLCDLLKKENLEYPSDAIRMNFTSNHDENSWSGSESERMGDSAEMFAALSYVLNGMPLIYSGQEARSAKRLEFFDKDIIDWSGYCKDNIYEKLKIVKNLPIMHCGNRGADLVRIDNSDANRIFSVKRKANNQTLIGLFNFSDSDAWFNVYDDDFNGEFNQIGSQDKANLCSDKSFFLPKCGWFIYFK